MSCVSPFRLFWVALHPMRTFAVTAVLVLGAAGWMAWTDPGNIEQAAALALLCQMFAAGTGYRERARRGHFDPVLVAGASRRLVAAAHWSVSVLPGAVVWVLLAAVESWSCSARPVTLTASGLTALLWVSTVGWAVALPLTRYASGIVWLIALFTLVAAQWAEKLTAPFLTVGSGSAHALTLAGAALVNPFLLILNPAAAGSASLLIIVVLAGGVAGVGAWLVATLDNSLQDPA